MKKRILITAAAALVAVAALLYLYSTAEGKGAGIPCMFYQITGIYCSGCGASRALRSILHLDFYQALHYNAYFTMVLPFLAVYFSFLGYSYVRYGKDKISQKISMKLLKVLVTAAILFWILRNIPAFAFLAPTTLT